MIVSINHNKKNYEADLSRAIDISIPMHSKSVTAWYAPNLQISAVKNDDWVGDTSFGSPVNFNNIFFNPHAHGTHTECVGHISKEKQSINQSLKDYFFVAKLISIKPESHNGDKVITRDAIESRVKAHEQFDTLLIRTLPNGDNKKNKNYSHTNPPFFSTQAMHYIVEIGINHLLVDLPSVDKEKDHGALACHKVFWGNSLNTRKNCTITEMIYVESAVSDGYYFLNLQFVPFENDASPSRPLLFKLKNKKN